MGLSRRDTLRSFVLGSMAVSAVAVSAGQTADQTAPDHDPSLPKLPTDEPRMPNGKSQRDEIAKRQHADALKDASSLITAAEELQDELKRAGDYTIPVASVRKTEEIEKLAKRIRSRLKN